MVFHSITYDDNTKFYHYVNDESTAILRKNNERKDHPLPGCTAAHLITFKPDGSAKLTLSLKNLDSSFNTDEFDFDAKDIENNDDDESVCDIVYDVEKLDLIEINSYVAIKAPSSSFEMFYIMKIINKGIATENISDSSNEHFVMTGEPYLIGKWVSFSHEGKKFIHYNGKPRYKERVNPC